MVDIQKHLSEVPTQYKHDTTTAPCLDPDWVYVPSAATDITKTWRKFGWVPLAEQGEQR